jgi:hypothetical protein
MIVDENNCKRMTFEFLCNPSLSDEILITNITSIFHNSANIFSVVRKTNVDTEDSKRENHLIETSNSIRKMLACNSIQDLLTTPDLSLLSSLCKWLEGIGSMNDVIDTYNNNNSKTTKIGKDYIPGNLFKIARNFGASRISIELHFSAQLHRLANFIIGAIAYEDL